MLVLESIQFIILGLLVAILMWDNRAAHHSTPVRIRVRQDRDRFRR
jgi:hypothetical protein